MFMYMFCLLWKAVLPCVLWPAPGLLAVACSERLGIVWCGWLSVWSGSGGAWHWSLITAAYRCLSYTALGPGAHFIHPALLPKACSILLWCNHLDINPTQASNEVKSLIIVLPVFFISFCGPAGWWSYMMWHLKSLSYFLLNESYRRIIVICWLDVIDNYLLQKMYWLPLWSFNYSWNTINYFCWES